MSSEVKPKEYSGEAIKGIFSRPQSIFITIETKKYGNVKFEVRPMNNDIYAQMGTAMKSTGVDLKNISNLDGLKIFGDVYYPAMKIVFPYCCINPKVVDGPSTDQTTLSLTDIPMEVAMNLFNQIMTESGLSDEAEEERKNT